MKFENICRHCKVKFESKECPETFCEDCEFLRNEGTLRVCDKCNDTWIVQYGENGYSVVEDDLVYELCPKCEVKHKAVA